MKPSGRTFVLLCAGEAAVVLAGMASLPAAFLLQFLLPLLLFQESFTPFWTGVISAGGYAAGLAVIGIAVLSSRHTTLPLLFISAFVVLLAVVLLLGEARLKRRYGGVT